jgi:UDP-N-acetylmuramoylalanine--D-glutamate ligase
MGYECQTVGITGTNGKSTTTALIGHVLNAAGINTAVGGNIGTPIFDLDMPDKNGVLVLELSSYQLDICPKFRPDISVLTNITPDHIDRHGTIENYAASKGRMFEGPGKAVIVSDDKFSQFIEKKISRTLLILPHDIEEQQTLRGAHNIENMEAAYAVCEALGLSKEQILSGFKTFPGLEHRQFLCRTLNNVEFVNDSKATNAEATTKALASYTDIFWIIGGLKKDGGLNGCEPFLNRIRKAYVIGEKPEDFVPYLEKHSVAFEVYGDMQDAVIAAHKDASAYKKNCTVLLSPATASFDQYKSFAKRGEHFEQIVQGL